MIDKVVMLEFLAEREAAEPGVYPSGGALFGDARHLEPNPSLVMNNIARALADLRRLGWIEWVYYSSPLGEPEPIPQHLTPDDIQKAHDIAITGRGHDALADRRRAQAGPQFNFYNSPIGQLALGDVTNIDLFTIIARAEEELERIDAPPEDKERARSALRQMAATGKDVATGAASALVALAVRKTIGL